MTSDMEVCLDCFLPTDKSYCRACNSILDDINDFYCKKCIDSSALIEKYNRYQIEGTESIARILEKLKVNNDNNINNNINNNNINNNNISGGESTLDEENLNDLDDLVEEQEDSEDSEDTNNEMGKLAITQLFTFINKSEVHENNDNSQDAVTENLRSILNSSGDKNASSDDEQTSSKLEDLMEIKKYDILEEPSVPIDFNRTRHTCILCGMISDDNTLFEEPKNIYCKICALTLNESAL